MSFLVHHDDHGWVHSYTRGFTIEPDKTPKIFTDSIGFKCIQTGEITASWYPKREGAHRFPTKVEAEGVAKRLGGCAVLEMRDE